MTSFGPTTANPAHLPMPQVSQALDDLGLIHVDTAVPEQERVIMGGGNRTSKLRPAPTELRTLPAVELVQGLAAPKETAPNEGAG